jgi:hypothetical protein
LYILTDSNGAKNDFLINIVFIMDLEQLFKGFSQQTEEARRSDLKFNGRAYWHRHKKVFEKHDQITASWIVPDESRRLSIKDLQEHNPDGSMNEKNHFIMQTVNIPLNEPATFCKIMQVALNIGQYNAMVDEHDRLSAEIQLYVVASNI